MRWERIALGGFVTTAAGTFLGAATALLDIGIESLLPGSLVGASASGGGGWLWFMRTQRRETASPGRQTTLTGRTRPENPR